MKNSLAHSFLQVLALLIGVLVASVCRDHANVPENYPEFVSTKASLALGVNGAQSFLRTPVSLAGGALNLGAWMGHQEMTLHREWHEIPTVSLRVRGDGRSHFEFELGGAERKTVLRLSNDPLHPSAWLVADQEGIFIRKAPFAYELPKKRWVRIELKAAGDGLKASADGVNLPSFIAPSVPLQVSLRGDSSEGLLRLNQLTLHAGSESYAQTFDGQIPWTIFLLATLVGYAVFFFIERYTSPGLGAGMSGALFLVACAFFALWTGPLARRYPQSVNLHGAPVNIASRAEVLARLAALSPSRKPFLLWLGGSQAWGAGASTEAKTAFSRLRASLGDLGFEWVNGAISGATVLEQKAAIEALKGKIGVVILVTGVNDALSKTFSVDLAATVAVARARGARVLLVPEPVEPPLSSEVAARQANVAAFAAREKIPLLSLQTFLDHHADDGFLWWDFVHLSDAGAKLVAEALAPALKANLSAPATR